MKHLISIDPSIRNCGIAYFLDKELAEYWLIKCKKESTDWRQRAVDVFTEIKTFVDDLRFQDLQEDNVMCSTNQDDLEKCTLICELPDYYMGKEEDQRSKSIDKVFFLCGLICSLHDLIDVEFCLPREWKGNMSKDVMQNRMIVDCPNLPVEKMDNNVLDAIMIGRWYLRQV